MRAQPEQSSHCSLVQLVSTRRVRDMQPFTFSLTSSGSRFKLSSTSVRQTVVLKFIGNPLRGAWGRYRCGVGWSPKGVGAGRHGVGQGSGGGHQCGVEWEMAQRGVGRPRGGGGGGARRGGGRKKGGGVGGGGQ